MAFFAHRNILFSAPAAMILRNFVTTGLTAQLEATFKCRAHLTSAYPDPFFADMAGNTFANHLVQADIINEWGTPLINDVTLLDEILNNIHMTGFAIEYPNGSLQNMFLSSQKCLTHYLAQFLTQIAPRGSQRRSVFRRLYGLYRPRRPAISQIFDKINPCCVLSASPGHFWLDYFILDEAKRRGIPSVSIIASWDNLYSRGPLCRRPDYMMVWSREMRQQAIDVHQYPEDRLYEVGSPYFSFYEAPVTAAERKQMRAAIGLKPREQYIAYVCGARTMHYDVEDVLAMVQALQDSPYKKLRLVVRPHPQSKREAYQQLLEHNVLLDYSPDLSNRNTYLEILNVSPVRHMASFLSAAKFVISSWGTTALLEACIFDTPAIQLRWMDSVPHAYPEDVQKVRDFQRYIHMVPFNRIGARPFSDSPDDLVKTMAYLQKEEAAFRIKRRLTVEKLICAPIGKACDRICAALQQIASQQS